MGRRLSGALRPGVGLVAIIAIGGLITCFPDFAKYTTATITALSVARFAFAAYSGTLPWLGRKISPWPLLGAAGVFFVFGAPVILSGDSSFAGYVKLDDTSTWLAFTDHVLTYGHSTAGIPASSYEATVQINLSAGYPLGAFIPLAVGHELTGSDSAWLFQPYLALMAAFMALAFYDLVRPVIEKQWVRSAVVFIAAQPALLLGYALWGGIKEVATALVVAVFAAVAWQLVSDGGWRTIRWTTPAPILAGSALIGVMGAGGAPWLLAVVFGVALLMVAKLIWLARSAAAFPKELALIFLARAGVVTAGVALIGLPTVFAAGELFSPNQGPLTNTTEMGNLIRELKLTQAVGPWLAGDFRIDPEAGFWTVMTAVAVGGTVIAWVFGVWASIVSRAWALLLFAGSCGLGSALVWIVGSPWVQGKALATGAASFLILAMVGVGALLTPRDWIPGADKALARARFGLPMMVVGAVLLVVPIGVLASNKMAYDDTYLAPRDQLAELESIGEDFAGEGPTLMTEYQAYGVRHFLRLAVAEGASELRRRQIPRRDGAEVEKGAWADTDELVLDPALEGLLTYRTLVLRRSPGQSRPPSPYELQERGEYYEVWQRPFDFDPKSLIVHVPLGTAADPASIPECSKIEAVARRAGPDGTVAAATRDANAVGEFTSYPGSDQSTDLPRDEWWIPDPSGGTLTPTSDGTATATIPVPADGEYEVFLGGSARGKVTLEIDGKDVGSVRNRLNNNGQFIQFDTTEFSAGEKTATLTYEQGGPFRPGVGGYPFGLGPIVLSPVPTDAVVELPAARAADLCGQRLDWIEALS